MDQYIVNGVEIELDTFDVDCIERYETGLSHFSTVVESAVEGEPVANKLRRACHEIMNFFDDVVGEGTAEQIFKGRTNARECYEAYNRFITDVSAKMAELKDTMVPEAVPLNRQQRREAERRK